MPARSPRRTFATPLVITLAACSSPRSPQPDDPNLPSKNPPAPADPEHPERRWHVTRNGADCAALPNVECPKPEPGQPVHTCNPPAPLKYTCPDGLADQGSLEVVRYAGTTECLIVPEPVACPPNTACNPPRPRPVICPDR